MDYADAANFLFDLRRFRMKPGTDATRRLLGHLGDPHLGIDYVQIAGSNGKGSTARMVETILREAGFKVGLYTSPHVDDVRERVRINDRHITKTELCEFVESIHEYVTDCAADGEAPTFFEVLTAMALWHFGRREADVAVIEVGIGGRHDSTSVIEPTASAVTSVTLEHTDVLGETVEEIARDKAHVAPPTTPLVTAASGEALEAVREQASDVVVVGEHGSVAVDYAGVVDGREAAATIKGEDWVVDTRLALLGAHQARNAGVAAVLARQVADLDEGTIARGLRRADWPGRFEVMERTPLVVLDGAHNPEACAAVAEVLAEFDYRDLHLVFGAMHDKDHRGMGEALPPPDSVVTCEPNLDRSEDRAVLARVFERAGIEQIRQTSSVETAVGRALAGARKDDLVLVTGSLYTVREARSRWTRVEIPKRVDDLEEARETLEGAHVTPAGVWRMRGKAVHRVLKTRVQPRQAQLLKEELLSLGGECAISGLNSQSEERLEVVMFGTLAQFKRLTEKLEDQPYGLPAIGTDVRAALGIGVEPDTTTYPWDDRPVVMGVLNVTPDSFHDGGHYATTDAAIDRAHAMIDAGAAIVDVGGESTRPGATPVPNAVERDRVIPVIEAIAGRDALVSIDTRKAPVARAALEAGADMVNDVSGLGDPAMRFLAADHEVPLVIMHSIDTPVVRGKEIAYDDVVEDVITELRERVLLAEKAGLDRSKIIVDPGLGFGKSAVENFELLGRLGELGALDCPVMVGHSHKSMFELLGYGPDRRTNATVGASAIAVSRGADIVRVHDVEENLAAIRAVEAAADPPSFERS